MHANKIIRVVKLGLMVSDVLAFGLVLFYSLFETYGALDHWMFVRVCTNTFALLIFWIKYRHYNYRHPFWDELRDIFEALFLTALIEVAVLSSLDAHFSFKFFLSIWCLTILLIPLFRFITRRILSCLNLWLLPCVIIGNRANAKDTHVAIQSEASLGFKVEAFMDPVNDLTGTTIDGIPFISMVDIENDVSKYGRYFLALEIEQNIELQNIVKGLEKKGTRNITIVPPLRGIPLYGMAVSHLFSHEIVMLRLQNNLIKRWSKIVKRTFDIFVSSILLVLLSPLFFIIAYKVRKDGGNAIYGHERITQNGRKFNCLKFRSMVNNSSKVLEDLLHDDPNLFAEWSREFKLKDDPRITPIGQFLRKSSLDELPQLINVLKGEMSLVGPRPVVLEELERYGDDVKYYLNVKSGMTGLWQVSGRSNSDYERRVYLDSWYVKNWSLWTDIVILIKTIKVVLRQTGAY